MAEWLEVCTAADGGHLVGGAVAADGEERPAALLPVRLDDAVRVALILRHSGEDNYCW